MQTSDERNNNSLLNLARVSISFARSEGQARFSSGWPDVGTLAGWLEVKILHTF